jgi:hypothetical protein
VNTLINEQLALPTRSDEDALLSALRIRAEQAVLPERIVWERCERSAERDDLRTRLALPRSAFDRIPTGCPWRGRVVAGRWMPRTVSAMSIGIIAPWSELAEGTSGRVTSAHALEWYRGEQAWWQQQAGTTPLVAAVGGALVSPGEPSPLPNLALLAWTGQGWRWGAGLDADPALARLFYPQTPAEIASRVDAHLDGSHNFPRLLSDVANDLGLPEAVAIPPDGKNLGSYALEYRSGHHLFYRR